MAVYGRPHPQGICSGGSERWISLWRTAPEWSGKGTGSRRWWQRGRDKSPVIAWSTHGQRRGWLRTWTPRVSRWPTTTGKRGRWLQQAAGIRSRREGFTRTARSTSAPTACERRSGGGSVCAAWRDGEPSVQAPGGHEPPGAALLLGPLYLTF